MEHVEAGKERTQSASMQAQACEQSKKILVSWEPLARAQRLLQQSTASLSHSVFR